MERQYPFAGKGGIKKNPIQKMGFNYSMQGQYKFTTNDDEFFSAKMFREGERGLRHSTSTNTNLKLLKYFTLSPSFSYTDTWYLETIEKFYDPINDQAVNDTIRGFRRFGQYNVSAALTTTIYGLFNFKKFGKLKSIRHTITPSISWGYRPDFAERYQVRVRNSSAFGDIDTYTPFDEGIYGGPSSGISNSIGLSLKNNFEAKLAPKDDSDDEEDRKITLLNNLNFSTGYNFAADSLRWSDVRVSAGTRLFDNKLNLNFSGSLDPYQVTETGTRLNKFNPGIFRLESAAVTANVSIASSDLKKDEEKDKKNQDQDSGAPPNVYETKLSLREKERAGENISDEPEEKLADLYRANIPWNISLVYSTRYANNGFSTNGIQTHTVGFSGNVELTPKWKIGYASGYDFLNKDFSYTRLNFTRDLDSWRINFNWNNIFGDNTSYYFFIGVKSSLLSDLKWDKNQPPDRVLF